MRLLFVFGIFSTRCLCLCLCVSCLFISKIILLPNQNPKCFFEDGVIYIHKFTFNNKILICMTLTRSSRCARDNKLFSRFASTLWAHKCCSWNECIKRDALNEQNERVADAEVEAKAGSHAHATRENSVSVCVCVSMYHAFSFYFASSSCSMYAHTFFLFFFFFCRTIYMEMFVVISAFARYAHGSIICP